MESTWNTSMKLMMDLPIETHRCLIEPISEVRHAKTTMIHRFLTFIQQIKKSPKNSSKLLLDSILQDARSTTGSNLRNILLQTEKSTVQELAPNDVLSFIYKPMENNERWKIPIIKEIIEIKNGNLEVDNFSRNKLEEMLDYLCTA